MGNKKIPICCLDAETSPFEFGVVPRPFVWGLKEPKEYSTFWGEEDLCTEFLMHYLWEYPYKMYLYAHNGGKFDFFFLLSHLDKGSIKLINGRISSATLCDGKIMLRDSYNIIPVPQRLFGKDEIKYWKMKKEHRNKYRAEILSYLQTDCFELHDKVTAFCNRFGNKMTLASAAMEELRKTIKHKTGRSFERFSDEQDEKFRPYYYGGRCEAFKKGKLIPKRGKWHVYDINSAYPFAMLHQHPDPTWNSFYVCTTLPSNILCYFAKIKAIARGCLPYRDINDNNKLTFPNDSVIREYFVTGWEIRAGLDTGTLKIIDILEVRVPDKTIDFSEYVNKYYAEKKEGKENGDKTTELFAKLLLNSAYGKFALNPREFKDYEIVEYGECPSEGFYWSINASYPEYGIDVYERKSHKPIEEYENSEEYQPLYGFYNVAVAASITGFVRAYLWRAICNSTSSIYCDTDSNMCEAFNGELGNELGQWKEEGQGDIAYIGGKKTYAIKMIVGKGYIFNIDEFGEVRKKEVSEGERWKIASKGARLTPEQIIKLVEEDATIVWKNPAPTFSLRFGARSLKREIRKT